MKRATIFLLVTWLSAGCVHLPGEKLATPETSLPAPRTPPAVTAERISSANAHQMGQALWDELDQDSALTRSSAEPTIPPRKH